MTIRALVFPGQGSQAIGMGKQLSENFSEAREVFAEVDEALKQKLFTLMTEGNLEELTDTRNTQPALMAVSVAVIKVIEKQGNLKISDISSYLAGHSLGEYSALCAAGAIKLSDTAKLLRIRGTAMQEAVPKGKGGMVALVGVDLNLAEEVAKKVSNIGKCQVANDNGGGQVVLSGEMSAIDEVVNIATNFGIKRAIKLPVSAPFHSSLMEPAAQIMAKALAEVNINKPSVPVIANVTAQIVEDPNQIRELLVKQVSGMVRWRQSVEKLKEYGVEQIIECGSGKVLSGLVKRIESSINTFSVHEPKDIEEILKLLS